MKCLLFCIVYYFSSFTLIAQTLKVQAYVFDSETKKPIPYATLQIANTIKYKDANELGYLEGNLKRNDTLILSCVGYKSISIAASTILINDTFFLKSQHLLLPEIKVGLKNILEVGIVNEKMQRSSAGGDIIARTEFATLIEVPKSIPLYKVAKVLIRGKDFKPENPIRLHIYSVDSIGLPDKELLNKEIIITKEDVDGKTVTIDISNQNIFLEYQSFFVGTQWITSTKVKKFTGPEIFETFKVKKLLTYRRRLNFNNNKWYGLFKKNFIFYPEGKTPTDDTPINVLASAEIEVYQ